MPLRFLQGFRPQKGFLKKGSIKGFCFQKVIESVSKIPKFHRVWALTIPYPRGLWVQWRFRGGWSLAWVSHSLLYAPLGVMALLRGSSLDWVSRIQDALNSKA